MIAALGHSSNDATKRRDQRKIRVRNPFDDPPDGLLEPLAINNSQLECLRPLSSQLRFQRLELRPRRCSAGSFHPGGNGALDVSKCRIESTFQLNQLRQMILSIRLSGKRVCK
jgi:hypothetical protein